MSGATSPQKAPSVLVGLNSTELILLQELWRKSLTDKITAIEQAEFENPSVVPWLSAHYLTYRTYLIFHILLIILLFSHLTNFGGFSYVITGIYLTQSFLTYQDISSRSCMD